MADSYSKKDLRAKLSQFSFGARVRPVEQRTFISGMIRPLDYLPPATQRAADPKLRRI